MKPKQPEPPARPALLYLSVLLLVLAGLFFQSFSPRLIVFSNDGPLGASSADFFSLPQAITGIWQDLNWIGRWAGSYPPNISCALLWVLGPVGFAKLYAPVCLLLLGLCAWVYFGQITSHPWVRALASLAATLNMDFFSNVCWGLGSRALTPAAIFLALAALTSHSARPAWPKPILAGLSVGIGILEGADIGAIFSLYVAGYAMFLLFRQKEPLAKTSLKAVRLVAVVAVFAALMAAHSLGMLIGTQVKGIAGLEPDQQQTKIERWNWATQWSLPKTESVRVLIPGLFGYRMDTPEGGNYWGSVGQTPGVEQSRYSGSGEYAGVLVVLIAAWPIAQAFRKKRSIFNPDERKFIWFWSASALISLLLAFGRHAPFYQLIYALPYFSAIRNPIKFMHPFHLSLLILFGYGLQGLRRHYQDPAVAGTQSWLEQLKSWWKGAAVFDKRWALGLGALAAGSLLGWLLYAAAAGELQGHLRRTGFDAEPAAAIARFSQREVGWYALFLFLSVTWVITLMSGYFSGRRVTWAAMAMGFLLVIDLGRANQPWIIYYEYPQKYAGNPVVDFLRDQTYQHRVIVLPFQADQAFVLFQQLYYVEWLQHLFPYYNVQSLDVIQEPREAADDRAFRAVFARTNLTLQPRLWELTNTRYLLGPAGIEQLLNQQLDPIQRRFQLKAAFDLVAKPGKSLAPGMKLEDLTVESKPGGRFGLIEFTGALPRAKLYSHWQVNTNDPAVLQHLANPDFDPAQTVIVAQELPAPQAPSLTNAVPGTVEYMHYEPKYLKFKAQAQTPSVLLLNDKYDPHWKVWVDGQPDAVLRLNFLMRGVFLKPGRHVIEFRFQPPTGMLYISLGAIVLGLALVAFLLLPLRGTKTVEPAVVTQAGPPEQKSNLRS